MTTSESVRSAFKYLFKAELEELKNLAAELPDNPVVINIGSGSGTSGLAFMESRDDMTLVTIDIQDSSSPFGCLAAERDVFAKAGYPTSNQSWYQVHGNSREVELENWMPYYVEADMIFIDGDHSYEGCMGDIKAWLPRLKWGGVLAIHDYEKQKRFSDQFVEDAPHWKNWPGVDSAVQEYAVWGKYDEFYVVETLAVFKGVVQF